MIQTDILIIGGGIAGLSLAINISIENPDTQILILTKDDIIMSSTNYAQGGIAASLPIESSIQKHIQDTLIAGNYQNDKSVVEFVVKNSSKAIHFLKYCEVEFEESLGLEGGHSERRIYHYKDITGKEIQEKLAAKTKKYKNIKTLEQHTAIDIIKKDNVCIGAKAFSSKDNKIYNIFSKRTILSTGGIGQIYSQTTNPYTANGDGISIAIKNNIAVKDLDLIQFHPTAIYSNASSQKNFLISEAVRGKGAFLENIKGDRFMYKYDKRGDLAPRDIVSISIFNEMKNTNSEFVYLNISTIPNFSSEFPNIHRTITELNIKEKIPVVPTAHYLCGGIKVDINSKTSMENLFAIGECANTGLHGSNRLASNSLLEAVVFSLNSTKEILKNISSEETITIQTEEETIENKNSFIIVLCTEKIKKLMQRNMGVQKSNYSINKALNEIEKIKTELPEVIKYKSIQLIELENMIILAENMIKESKERTKNTGVFYNKNLN